MGGATILHVKAYLQYTELFQIQRLILHKGLHNHLSLQWKQLNLPTRRLAKKITASFKILGPYSEAEEGRLIIVWNSSTG